MNGGYVGTLLGMTCAGAAIAFSVLARRRGGDPHPLRSTLGLTRHDVERHVYVRAASAAFPLYAAVVMVYLLFAGAPTSAGILGAAAGVVYGGACAWTATSLSR